MVFLAGTNALNGKAFGLSLRVGPARARANSSRQPGKHAGASEALHRVDEAGVTQAVRWRKLTVCVTRVEYDQEPKDCCWLRYRASDRIVCCDLSGRIRLLRLEAAEPDGCLQLKFQLQLQRKLQSKLQQPIHKF